MQPIKKLFRAVAFDTTGHAEKFISAAGGFVGILLTMWISLKYLGAQGAAMLVASTGASAVILFAVPHSPLSQGLAIGAMHYLHCIHPPGGATALTSVAGGASVHDLGYHFVLTPVLLNVAILMITAVVVNFVFPWRRYPTNQKVAQVKLIAPD